MVVLKPNVVRGGRAIGLGNNLYLMKGRTHSKGGIDIGKNPKTGLEVENNEVMQVSPQGVRVFSAQPILGGISPAQYILGGANPNQVFNAQEQWKKVNKINDDGTRKARFGTEEDSKRDSSQVNTFRPSQDNSKVQPNRIAHRKSLEKFIKDNPTLYGINTADFVDFMLDNATMESNNNPTASHGSMYGYYQLKGLKRGSTEEQQHRAAYRHLSDLFKNVITDADIEKAKELGISQAQLLHKFWNQERKVLNYLYQGKDSEDGLGTKISEWGNNNNLEIDYSPYVMKAIKDKNYTIQKGDYPETIMKRYRGYGDKIRTFNNYNKDINTIFGVDTTKPLKIGDILKNKYYQGIGPIKEDGTFKYGGRQKAKDGLIKNVKQLIDDLKNERIGSGIEEVMLKVFNRLPKKIKERAIEVAMRTTHNATPDYALENYYRNLKNNKNFLKNDIDYIIFNKNKPSININDGLYHLDENAFGELPSQAGPIAIVKDSSASDSALSVSQLNQDIKKRLRDAGVEEKNLSGILYNDINKIRELLNSTNNPNSETILKDIQREIQLKGADIEFYNQLQDSNMSKKAQEAIIFQSAIDGGVDPNELNQSKDNRYINKYNEVINSYVGNQDGLVYNFNKKRIDDIISKYGGEQKLKNAGYYVRNEEDGSKSIIIPKEVVHNSTDLLNIINASQHNMFKRGGKFGTITNGNINVHTERESQSYPSFSMFYRSFTDVQKQAQRQTSKSTNINQEIEVPTSVSPTSSPMMYGLAVLRDSAPDKKTRDYYNALMTDKKQLLENEINGLDFRTGNYTIIDENGRTKELDDKEKRAYQAKWDTMKASGYKFGADNALMYTNPWTGESYTYLSLPLDKDESVRVVFDKGRWAQEFNNLNASFTRQADAALYRSSRTGKPIQVGFVGNSNMMLRYDTDDTYGNHYYDLTLGDNIIRKDLDAEEARNYMYVYQLLLSLGDGFRTLDVTKPSANPKMTNGQYIEAYIEQLAKNYEPFYGSQSEDIVRSILGF